MKKLSFSLVAALLSTVPAIAQTPVWTMLNIGIARNVSPVQLGVDIGTISTNFITYGTVVGNVFSLNAPTPTARGGVTSALAPTNQFQTGIDTTGAPTFAQPSFSNLTGNPTSTQVTNALGFTPLNRASNLSDLASAATARTNLGLSPVAIAACTGPLKANGASASTCNAVVPSDIAAAGSSGQIQINSSGALGAMPAVNGDGTLNTSTGALVVTKSGGKPIGSTLCGSLVAANMNSTADQAITITPPSATYAIQNTRFWNPSTSLTTAVGGIYSATSKGGQQIVGASQAYSGLTTNSPNTPGNLLSVASPIYAFNVTTFYLSLTTAQGATATANVDIYCLPL